MPLISKNIAGHGTETALHNHDFSLLEAAASLTFLGAASVVALAPAAIAGSVVPLYEYRKKGIE